MEKISRAKGNENKAGVAILLPDKKDFETNIVTRDKEGHYIMMRDNSNKKVQKKRI